jgi:hypothetical protein
MGGILAASADFDYVDEEWFASGQDRYGQAYVTQVYVRRPRTPGRFSGTLLIEPLHFSGVASVHMVASPYMLRSGHAWACVAAQKMPLDRFVKPFAAERYASLHVENPPNTLPPDPTNPMAQMMIGSDVCNDILAQSTAALRARRGPFSELHIRHALLIGHSQTGMVTTSFIQHAHESMRLASGGPVFDGYFPAGAPITQFGPRDVPLIQVLSDADICDAQARFGPVPQGRTYRRPDSDAPIDRYRLYELAGFPHAATRYPPVNNLAIWRQQGINLPDTAVLNSLPHNEMFQMGLQHLVQWVSAGTTPPRAERIELAPDGRYFAKDGNGNSRGGVRCVQMDVPHSAYMPALTNPDGTFRFGSIGLEQPFDVAKMRQLYGDKATYVLRFNQRLDALVKQGWFLQEDTDKMRQEAQAQDF